MGQTGFGRFQDAVRPKSLRRSTPANSRVKASIARPFGSGTVKEENPAMKPAKGTGLDEEPRDASACGHVQSGCGQVDSDYMVAWRAKCADQSEWFSC